MSQQSLSKNPLVIIGVVVVVLVIVLLMQNGTESVTPSATPGTTDSTPITDSSVTGDQTNTQEETIPAPAAARTPASIADVDAVLQELDTNLTEGEYDTENVTELFEETTDESLTKAYEL